MGNRSIWERRSDPSRYEKKFRGMPDSQIEATRAAQERKIQDALASGAPQRRQAKFLGQYLALGGTQEEYDALINQQSGGTGGGGGTTQPGGRPIDSDQNPYTGYGPSEVSQQVPGWMDRPTGKWDALNQAMTADWVQQQMQAENRKLAQAGLGEGIDDIQARLIDTPAIGQEQIGQMRGAYESRLGMDEAAQLEKIKADMARRGIQYNPASGIGGGMTGFAGLKRQMGAAQAGRDLDIYANQQNRAALERGIGARESVRGNWANIGTGFGATPFTMPNPSEVGLMYDPDMFQPQSNNASSYANAAGGLLGGIGSLIGGLF